MRKPVILGAIFLTVTWLGAQTQTLPTPTPPNTLLSCEQTQGFQLLFDGNIASFRGNFANYQQNSDVNTDLGAQWTLCAADSSVCTNYSLGSFRSIRSRQKYGDFDLRMDYRNNGDAGIFYRGLTRTGAWWGTAVEFGVDDRTNLTPKELAGSLFAVFPPSPFTYNTYASGKWNSVRIVAKGDSIEHWVNNTKVLGYRFWNARWNTALAASKFATDPNFAQNTTGCKCLIPSGFFGFQDDRQTNWRIRNLRINANGANVNLGPANCPATAVAPPARSLPYTLERGTGFFRLHFPSGLTRAELAGLDGRSIPVAIAKDGLSAQIPGRIQPGVYLLRVFAPQSQTPQILKLFLP